MRRVHVGFLVVVNLILVCRANFNNVALQETNKYRRMHGAQNLKWDNGLSNGCSAWARQMANTNNMRHSSGNYGENLWMMSGAILKPEEYARKAVKSWYDEVSMYNYNNPSFTSATGHFTALVWKSSNRMGMGWATNPRTRSTYVCARYSPAGNFQGRFKQNVAPRTG